MSNTSPYSNNWSPPPSFPQLSPSLKTSFFKKPQTHREQSPFEEIPLQRLTRNRTPIIQSSSTNPNQSPSTTLRESPPSPTPTRSGRTRIYPISIAKPPTVYFPPDNNNNNTNVHTQLSTSHMITNPNDLGNPHRSERIQGGKVKRMTCCEWLQFWWHKYGWKIKGFVSGFLTGLVTVGIVWFVKSWWDTRQKLKEVEG